MPSLRNLKQLLNVIDVRISLSKDPDVIAELEARRQTVADEIDKLTYVAPRLPYGDQ